MELNTETFTVKVNGSVHTMSYPTVKQIKEMEENKEELSVDSVCKLVSDCGMPFDVVENLQSNHLNSIIEVLVGKTKLS